ncbi:MAG: hypothetical protein CEE38_00680 [Planctomycetes bacterium B3_Pla]|nr:MAG: hypothetical protein CEE38_00680 [Planctomycetes bacterium B3_Pla]
MNCTECKELLVAHIEGLLDASQEKAVEEHLKDCSACQAEAETLIGLHDRLASNGRSIAQRDLENDVMNQIVREQKARLKTAEKAAESLKLRRFIMKSRFAKIAAAAVIIIAVLIGINPLESSITFADVVEPILNAKTVIFDMVIGSDDSDPVMHEVVVGSRIRRTLSNLPGLVQILDLDSGRMLALDTAGKTGSYIDIGGFVQDGTQNYVEFLQQIIRQVQDGNVEKLSEQDIDGKKAIGFVGKGQNEDVTIWADPKTGHPLRIELRIGQTSIIMKNFQFDVPVDDALVSMELPAGYTEEEATADLTDLSEQDFVESLRIFAEIIGDDVFPDAVGTEITMKQMPVLVEKAQQKGISDEEIGQLGTKLGRGMLFHQMLDAQGQWNYAGAGVKLGDAATAIFWYQPAGSQTYRVIYGDLSAKDVAPENLPQ